MNILDLAEMRLVLNRHGRGNWKLSPAKMNPRVICVTGDTGRNHAFIGPMQDGRCKAVTAQFSVIVRDTLPETLAAALDELRHVP